MAEGPSVTRQNFGVKFDLDITGMMNRLGALSDKVFPYIKKTWEQIAKWALSEVQHYTPPTHTGTDIRSMWILETTSTEAVTEFLIRNTYKDPQVITWFEEGTEPHEIPPGPCGFLHFFTYEGQEIYTKKPVQHPGTVAWRMAEQTVQESTIIIDQYIEQTFLMVDQMLGGT